MRVAYAVDVVPAGAGPEEEEGTAVVNFVAEGGAGDQVSRAGPADLHHRRRNLLDLRLNRFLPPINALLRRLAAPQRLKPAVEEPELRVEVEVLRQEVRAAEVVALPAVEKHKVQAVHLSRIRRCGRVQRFQRRMQIPAQVRRVPAGAGRAGLVHLDRRVH